MSANRLFFFELRSLKTLAEVGSAQFNLESLPVRLNKVTGLGRLIMKGLLYLAFRGRYFSTKMASNA